MKHNEYYKLSQFLNFQSIPHVKITPFRARESHDRGF